MIFDLTVPKIDMLAQPHPETGFLLMANFLVVGLSFFWNISLFDLSVLV